MYPQCKPHVLYCILMCILPDSTIFFHIISKNGTIFGKTTTEHKMGVLVFSTTFVWDISHSAQYFHKCAQVFMYSALPLFLSDFNEIEFSRQFSQK
jgi:hypothetical protein